MMNIFRTTEETARHAHPILTGADRFRVCRCSLDADFGPSGQMTLHLTLASTEQEPQIHLRFDNVHIAEPLVQALRDATGLYVMDTLHLGYSSDQRIEVGDDDDGAPLFWAETVQKIGNPKDANNGMQDSGSYLATS